MYERLHKNANVQINITKSGSERKIGCDPIVKKKKKKCDRSFICGDLWKGVIQVLSKDHYTMGFGIDCMMRGILQKDLKMFCKI